MKRLIFLLVALAVLCGAYFRLREARDAEEEAIARADVKRMLENFARQRDFLDSLSPEKRAIELLKLQSREATTPPYPDLEMINNETPQPPTLWREAETKRYAALFDGTKVDLLVVPFQVQGFAIERSQRSLMTGLLSSALSKSAQRLANPSWVAKALGDGDRRIDRDAVFRLASAIGAQRILWTYVGHKDATFLHLYFQFQERNKDGSFSETPDLPGKLIADIGFDDENPPILAFQKNLKKIIGMLGYDFSETLPLPAKNLDTAFPADFAAMLQMKDPANSAQQLQLLAHLLPEDAWREKERLFERSLLLAWQFSPEHPSARRLLARAYYGLGMRPSALAAIQSPQNDVERALAALLNGNLPDLENYRSLIPNSPERLMAEIDVVDVRFAYEKPQGKDTDDFISDLPNVLKHFSQRRIADADPVKLRRFNNFQILQFLGEEFPSAGQGITQLLRGKRIAGQRMGSEEIDLLLANYLDPRLAFPEPSSHGTSLSWALNKLDILEFLSQSALANLIYAADRMARTQAVYTSAIDYIDGIGPLFGSHPEILAARAYAEHHGPAQQLSGEARKDLIAQNTKNIGLSTYWLSMSHDHHASDRPTSSLSNATYGAWLLEKFFRDVRDTAEKEKLLKETKDRFSGSGMRELLTAELRESEGNSEAAKAALQTAIHANITKKTVYVRLGELLMREGRYSEAADVFASFPGMDKKGYSLSSDNFAYVTGSRFFQLGETDLSKPFFKIASASHTGSGASMMSAVR
ncbi:MAG: hypothetical protein LBJ76_02605, partial [Candidatus Accumulibacter sp.]|nr:hypothetical protein [Accumulibacter sp.]